MGKTYDSEKEVAESISNDLKNEIFFENHLMKMSFLFEWKWLEM